MRQRLIVDLGSEERHHPVENPQLKEYKAKLTVTGAVINSTLLSDPTARRSVIKKSANRIKILLRSKIIGLRHQKKTGIFRQHTDPVFPAPRSSASMSRFLTSIEDVKARLVACLEFLRSRRPRDRD